MADSALKHTLIVEIALPDFYADDYLEDEGLREALALMADCEGVEITAEWIAERALEESGETAGGFVRLSLLTGSKNGNELQRMDGFIVGARIVPREPDHDRVRDERLIEHEEDWVRAEAGRLEVRDA